MNKQVKPEQLDLKRSIEPTPTERRKMLIEGVKHFDKTYPNGMDSPEEAVDNFLARKGPQWAQAAPMEETFDWHKDTDCIILHEQPATAVYRGAGDHIVIRQTNGHEDDVTILIAPENATAFMEGLAKRVRET